MEIFGTGDPFKQAAGNFKRPKTQLCVFIRPATPANAARGDSRISTACKG
jgi:hypothetical protein